MKWSFSYFVKQRQNSYNFDFQTDTHHNLRNQPQTNRPKGTTQYTNKQRITNLKAKKFKIKT